MFYFFSATVTERMLTNYKKETGGPDTLQLETSWHFYRCLLQNPVRGCIISYAVPHQIHTVQSQKKKKRQAVEREHFISARRLSENFPSSGIYDPTLQRTTSQAPFAYALWILTLDLIRSALFAPSLRLTPIAPFVFVHSFIIQCFCAQRYTGSSVSCFHQIRNVTTTKKIQSFLWFAHLEKVVRAVFSLASTTVTPSIDASLKNPSNLYKMLQLDFT